MVGGAKIPGSSATKPASVAKANPVTNSRKTSSVSMVTKPRRVNTLTNVREWFRVNVPEIGLVTAGMGGYYFAVKKGDGGSSGRSGVGVKGTGKGEKADYFIGSLKGEKVHLKGVKVEKLFTLRDFQKKQLNLEGNLIVLLERTF